MNLRAVLPDLEKYFTKDRSRDSESEDTKPLKIRDKAWEKRLRVFRDPSWGRPYPVSRAYGCFSSAFESMRPPKFV